MPPKTKMTRANKRRSLRRARTLTLGPGPVSIQLQVNGQTQSTTAEPWLTLLQVLREKLGLTGAKQVCDHATCGACTVLANGKRVYACSMLAVDSQDLQLDNLPVCGSLYATSVVSSLKVILLSECCL